MSNYEFLMLNDELKKTDGDYYSTLSPI